MGTTNIILIVAAEAVALCLFIIAILLLKNRKLQKLIRKLQQRAEDTIQQLRQKAPPKPVAPPPVRYEDKINDQLAATKEYHFGLGSRQDIALDLDPDAPLPRRTAALRHAFLIAEKEACTGNEAQINWDFLAARYQQLLSFNEDYPADIGGAQSDDLDQLQNDLEQAKKRINNLERFKVMYFELEEKWDQCKIQANEHYTELKSIAKDSEHKENLERLIESYRASYQDIGNIIERSSSSNSVQDDSISEIHLGEIKRLREVAADQHKIINELQEKLSSAASMEEKEELVQGLQSQLQKQSRFLQESETCIKLMEDELANANNEIEILRSKAVQVNQLKSAFKELQSAADTREQVVASLKTENRRLAKKLKLTQEAPPEDNQESRTLRKELSTLQSKYNDLEEKFLNLKLKG